MAAPIYKSFIKLMRTQPFLVLLTATFLVFSCKKETEAFKDQPVSDYIVTQPGKFIIYRTDSTLFPNFGASTKINSYQEKFEIDAATTDNLGRPSYRVFRSVRDTAGSQAWQSKGTLFFTPATNGLEVVENNLRFLKLAGPVKQDNTWKGNRYLPNNPYSTYYEFSNDVNIADWDYTYKGVDETTTLNGKKVMGVATVEQISESVNAPVTLPGAYGYVNTSVEKYAKGIGMVYQELTMWEYQPPSSPRPGYRGFGVKRSMLDHN